MPVYSAHLRNIIREGIDSKEGRQKPLAGFKVAVDAGNGSGGFLATDVLAELGADTSGRLTATAARTNLYSRNVRKPSFRLPINPSRMQDGREP